jgi:hypothetical protein
MMPRIRLEASESVVAGGWWLVAGCWLLVAGCWFSAYGIDALEDSRVARGSESEEGEIFDLPGLVQAHGALGERFNFGF